MGLYWPNFSLVFLIHLSLYAGVYCIFLHDLSWRILLIIHKFLSKEANQNIFSCEETIYRSGWGWIWKMLRTSEKILAMLCPQKQDCLVCRSTNKMVRHEGSRLFWPLGFFPATNRLQVFMFLLLRRRMGEITASVQKQDTRK